MKKTLTYKGYSACIDFDAEDHIFVGNIAGVKEAGRFHGTTVRKLETAFKETVDHYLDVCEKLKSKAVKPYSGNLMLRIPPETHASIATAADLRGKSINQWAASVLEEASKL